LLLGQEGLTDEQKKIIESVDDATLMEMAKEVLGQQ
jgi:hypothetical protein